MCKKLPILLFVFFLEGKLGEEGEWKEISR